MPIPLRILFVLLFIILQFALSVYSILFLMTNPNNYNLAEMLSNYWTILFLLIIFISSFLLDYYLVVYITMFYLSILFILTIASLSTSKNYDTTMIIKCTIGIIVPILFVFYTKSVNTEIRIMRGEDFHL